MKNLNQNGKEKQKKKENKGEKKANTIMQSGDKKELKTVWCGKIAWENEVAEANRLWVRQAGGEEGYEAGSTDGCGFRGKRGGRKRGKQSVNQRQEVVQPASLWERDARQNDVEGAGGWMAEMEGGRLE